MSSEDDGLEDGVEVSADGTIADLSFSTVFVTTDSAEDRTAAMVSVILGIPLVLDAAARPMGWEAFSTLDVRGDCSAELSSSESEEIS